MTSFPARLGLLAIDQEEKKTTTSQYYSYTANTTPPLLSITGDASLDDEKHSPLFSRASSTPGVGSPMSSPSLLRSMTSPSSTSSAGQPTAGRRGRTSHQHVALYAGYSVATELLSDDLEEAEADMEEQKTIAPSWTDISESPGKPGSMSGQTMVCYERSAYVFGGYDEGQALTDCYSFDLDTLVWTKLEVCGDIPTPRTSHSAVVDHAKGKMYVLCGSGSAFGHTNLGDFYEFDMKLRMWTKLTFTGDEITPRYGQSTVLFQDKMYLFGGTFGREFSQEMFVLDLTKKKASRINCSGTFPSPRYKHSAGLSVRTGEMVVFGGAERLNYKLADVFVFNINSHKWSLVRCTGDVPSGRFAHTMSMSADGRKAYVFGGTDRVNCFNDLYEFDMEQKHWTKINISGQNAPKPRYFHSACLDRETGFLYIWGGKGSTSAQVRFADMFRIQVEKSEQRIFQERCTLVQDLTEMLWNEDLVDLEILCENGIVLRAHDLIIKARLGSSCSDLLQIAQRLSSNVVEMILYFIYSDNLIISRTIPPVDYLMVLIAGTKLRLNRLVKLCFKRIQEILSRKFAVQLIELIKDLGCEGQLPLLEKYLLLYTSLHFGQGKLPDNFSSDEFSVAVPPSTMSQDLLKLRKPLSFVAIGNKCMDKSPSRKALDKSPSRKGFAMVAGHTPSASIFMPPPDLKFHFGLTEPSPIEIKAHTIILASRSKYFGSPSFREIMIEGQEKTCIFPTAEDELPGTLSPSAFSFLLDYLYGGRSVLPNLSVDFAKEFVRADVCNYFSLSSDELYESSKELLASSRTFSPLRRGFTVAALSPTRSRAASPAPEDDAQPNGCSIM